MGILFLFIGFFIILVALNFKTKKFKLSKFDNEATEVFEIEHFNSRQNIHTENTLFCNPNVSYQITIKINEKNYNICKCKYDHLITKHTLFDECNYDVACNGYGYLKSITNNPMLNGECICTAKNTYKTFDTKYGPKCQKERFFELKYNNVNYEHELKVTSHYIDLEYKKFFSYPETRSLPNPCNYDAVTNEPISELFSQIKNVLVNGKFIAMCHPLDNRYTTVLFESDYLFNNNGKFANAIKKVSNKNSNIQYRQYFNNTVYLGYKHANNVIYWLHSLPLELLKIQLQYDKQYELLDNFIYRKPQTCKLKSCAQNPILLHEFMDSLESFNVPVAIALMQKRNFLCINLKKFVVPRSFSSEDHEQSHAVLIVLDLKGKYFWRVTADDKFTMHLKKLITNTIIE